MTSAFKQHLEQTATWSLWAAFADIVEEAAENKLSHVAQSCLNRAALAT
jgi:hypothetical protein